jgi:2-polyprenyl-3-methyl-5-hydroxy-6-metoxy-1,4-benzoquinol methylase
MPSNLLAGRKILQHVRCNLCGADDSYRLQSERLEGAGVLHLVRCRQCGLVYVTPRLTEEVIQELYERDYFQTGNGARRGYCDYIADQEYLMRTFHRRMRWIEQYTGMPGRLLDVGCAAGFFLQVSYEHGWKVFGVEPAACMANYARSHLDMDVFGGTLRDVGFPSRFFDVVTMWDVLEHMIDPHAELLEVQRVLRRDGVLVLETQNIASWAPRLLGKHWIHYGNDLHLFHFSPATITRILADTGFNLIKITTASAGKVCSMQFLTNKLRHLSGKAARLADTLLRRWPELARHSIYVNLGDEMIVCAQKCKEVV